MAWIVKAAGASEYRARYLYSVGRQTDVYEDERVSLAQAAGH
jgi:hypothetical protein